MYKTNSSKEYGVLFPNEMFERLVAFTAITDKKLPWHIRQACIEYLAKHGVDVSDLTNPEGRGARSDLKSAISKSARERAIKKASRQVNHQSDTEADSR